MFPFAYEHTHIQKRVFSTTTHRARGAVADINGPIDSRKSLLLDLSGELKELNEERDQRSKVQPEVKTTKL